MVLVAPEVLTHQWSIVDDEPPHSPGKVLKMLVKNRKLTCQNELILAFSCVAALLQVTCAGQLAGQENGTPVILPVDDKQTMSITGTLDDGSELTKSLMDIKLNVIDHAESKPVDQTSKLQEISYASNYPGMFDQRVAMWAAPNIRYQPLFFEDVGLERYGYHHGDFWQPWASALHFGNSFTFLPLSMRHQNPNSCEYPLGFCRPGSIAPKTRTRWLR